MVLINFLEKFTYLRSASGIKEENQEASLLIAEICDILAEEGLATTVLKYIHFHGYSTEKTAFIAHKIFMNSNQREIQCPAPKMPF